MSESTEPSEYSPEGTVLIAVLKAPRDLETAARDHWYRIPFKNAPKSHFTHIAFYQPACFKTDGKRLACYAEVTGHSAARRIEIFPEEPGHPAAQELYVKYRLGPLLTLPTAVLNRSGSRVSFGYAPLKRLSQAVDILGIFNVFPIENMMSDALKSAGVVFFREHNIMRGRKVKYRLDFALLCKKGKLDIECDGHNWHSTTRQHVKDSKRNKWLRRNGWTILRFGEPVIVNDIKTCIAKINTAVEHLGGQLDNQEQ